MADGFVGQAWVQISPSFQGFQSQIAKEMQRSMPAIGKQAGIDMGKGVTDQAGKVGQSVASNIGDGLKKISVKALDVVGDTLVSVGRSAATAGGLLTGAAVAFGTYAAKSAMRVEELDIAMRAVAKSSNLSYDAMTQQVGLIRKQGIEAATAQQLVIDFARANMNLADSSKLARVAQDAAVISQTNSTEAAALLMHGIQTLNPVILRQLGIMVSADQAYEKYAATIGKSAKDLSGAEKQQAFLNEVLAQGATIAGTYEASMAAPGKLIRSFPRLFNDAAVAIGKQFTPALGEVIKPFYDFTKSLTESLEVGGKLHPVVKTLGEVFTTLLEPLKNVATRLQGWFKNLGTDQIQSFANVFKELGPILPAVGTALATFAGKNLGGSIPIVGDLLGKMNPLVAGLVALVVTTPALREAFTQLMGAVAPLLPVLGQMAATFLQALAPAVGDLLKALMPMVIIVLDLVTGFVNLIAPIKPLATVIGGALVGAFVAWKLSMLGNPWLMGATAAIIGLTLLWQVCKPLAIAILAVAAAVVVWTAVSWAFTAVPVVAIVVAIIGAVVALVAGIVWLVLNWRTAWDAIVTAATWAWQTVLQPVFSAIAAAATWLWQTVLQPVFSAIAEAWRVMVDAMVWAWDNILRPAWDVIAVILKILFAIFIAPTLIAIWVAWQVMSLAIKAAWDNIIKPAWDAMAAAIQWLWGVILQPIFAAIGVAWNALGAAFSWVWLTIIKPAWDALTTAFQWAWDNVIRPIFDFIKARWGEVGDAIRWVWENVIKPAWQQLEQGIEHVRDVFKAAVQVISEVWDGVKKAIGTPVKWVIDNVINNLIKGANLILDKIDLHIDPIDTSSIPTFARGGLVPGGWGGGDRQLILAEPGEWVLTKRQAAAMGYTNLRMLPHYREGGPIGGGRHDQGPGGRAWWNPIDWGKGLVGAVVGGFEDLFKLGGGILNAASGLIRWAAFKAFEAGTAPLKAMLDKTSSVDPPLFFTGAVSRFGKYLIDKMLELIKGKSESEPSIAMLGGMAIDDIARAIMAQFPQLVVTSALRPGDPGYHGRNLARDLGGPQRVMDEAGAWTGGPASGDLWRNLAEGIHQSVTGPAHLSVKNGAQVSPSFWGPNTWAGHIDHLHLAAEAIVASIAGPGGAVDRWRPVVEQAFKLWNIGATPDLINAILLLIKHESGGNPNIQNNWDINAQRGIPSGGLMQTIMPTFMAYRHPSTSTNMFDPLANIAAGINYIWKRYGSVFNLAGFKSVMRGGGWIGYDEGGFLPPGAHIVVNQTGRPEPVLTSEQWEKLTTGAGQAAVVIQEATFKEEADLELLLRKAAWAVQTRLSA